MKYLVTGADGFIGMRVLKLLADKSIPARAMLIEDHGQVLPGDPERVVADLLDCESLKQAVQDITHVVHLAARVHMMHDKSSDPLKAFEDINVAGTLNLLEAMGHAGGERFLFMSSVKAMGEESVGVFDEDSPCNPATPYGISKYHAEKEVLSYGDKNGMHCTVLRLPMVYGPGNKGNMLPLLKKASNGKRLPFGSINNRRSMVYVDNAAEAVYTAMASDKSAGRTYIITDAEPYSTKELYQAIGEAFGMRKATFRFPLLGLRFMGFVGSLLEAVFRRPMPINSDGVKRLAGDLLFSSKRIRTELGFVPFYGLREGIRLTVAWYRNQEDS
jgi:nucleoside-diphosphate-sugar epimerase